MFTDLETLKIVFTDDSLESTHVVMYVYFAYALRKTEQTCEKIIL